MNMPRIQYEGKVTLGNVLTLVAMIGTLLAGYINLKLDVAAQAVRIEAIAEQLEPVDPLETRMAVVERTLTVDRLDREADQARMEDAIKDLARQNVLILQATARLEAKVLQ